VITARGAAVFLHQDSQKAWSIAELPIRKDHFTFRVDPDARKEVNANSAMPALTPYHRILLMTLYATGVRNARVDTLEVSDIDSKRMVIHIQGARDVEIAM